MKYLNFKKLPECYGVKVAEDIAINDVLRERFDHFVELISYQTSYGTLASFVEPGIQKSMEGIFESFFKELVKDRGRGKPCAECEFVGPCFQTAGVLLGNESYWLSEDSERVLE